MNVDDGIARLEAILRPRVGKRMTRLVLQNLARLKESGAGEGVVLGALHATLDAYARIPESGTPFPLGVAKALCDAACPKLWLHNTRRTRAGFGMLDVEAQGIAMHADALLPSYGDDDAEFAVRVAYKNAHHYRANLVVGRAWERNDPAPTQILDEAWSRQGRRGVPVAAVPDDMGPPGVIYALAAVLPSTNIAERFVPAGFVFEPDHGDPLSLDDVAGVQRFLAAHPLPIAPHTLAWLLHLVRFAFPAVPVDVEGGLGVAWEPLEAGAGSSAASLLLGLTGPPVEQRAEVRIRAGAAVLSYRPGELAPG